MNKDSLKIKLRLILIFSVLYLFSTHANYINTYFEENQSTNYTNFIGE